MKNVNYPKNLLIAYLNISSLRNKIIDLGEIMSYLSPDYLVLSETKLDDSFPSAQFSILDYRIRARRDKHKNGGGLIEFVKKVLICKRLKNLKLAQVNAFALKLLYLRGNGKALVSIGQLLTKIWKYFFKS